jgi:ligand-binding sensor domain-containing protein
MRFIFFQILYIAAQYILFIIPVHSQVFSFERAMPGNISEVTIFGIVQDRNGFIWYATRDGLWRFDGHNTTEYRYDPADTTSISSSFVRAITVDRQGNLWVGTSGGGLNRYVPEYDHFQRYMYDKDNPQSLSHNDVLHIYQDKTDVIWVCTEDGYNRMDKENGTFKRYYLEYEPTPGMHNRAILTCIEDSHGNFWVGSYFRGLFKFDRERETFDYVDLNKLTEGSINYPLFNIWSLMEDHHRNLWIGTHNQGLFKYNPETGETSHFHREGDNYHQISTNIIYRLMEDTEGRIWMGTAYGLNIYDPENKKTSSFFSSYENPTTISTNSIWAIMQDSSGTVWLGGWEGYADKWDRKSRRFAARMSEGIYPPTPLQYNAILKDSRDRLLVGTNSGLLIFPDFSKIKNDERILVTNDQPRYFSGLYISSITEDSFGDIWVGTNQGIRRFNHHPANAEVYYSTTPFSTTGIASNFISSIMEDSRNTIWIGTQNGLHQYVRHNNTFRQYHAEPFVAGSLSHKYVTTVYEDNNGVIWAGTPSGLNRLNQSTGSFSSFHHVHDNPMSLANGVINIIFQDSRGLLWVGTTAGLSCAIDNSGYFNTYTVENGLPGNIISAMYEDNAGYIWVSTNQGVSRLEITLPEYSQNPLAKLDSIDVSFWNFTESDGMIDASFKRGSVARLSNGEVLFGSTYGISSFFPDSIKSNSFIPPIQFTDLKIHNKSVKPVSGCKLLEKHISLVEEITLNYKQSVVTFDFQSLSFTNSHKNQYAYIMEGFDKEWTYAGNRRTATYTNLNQGKYIFKVKASNNDGVME